jgi:hypothetical protein
MKDQINGTNCSLIGFGYFLARPYLWIGPLFAALLALIILMGVFFLVAYFSWPTSVGTGWLSYSWGVLKSFGYASISILALWVSLFPIILNVAFERMAARILHENKKEVKAEGMGQATFSSIQVIFRTLGWRLFWPLAAIVCLFFFGPLTIFIAQIGMAHIAVIDGCDLSLSVQGVKGSVRIKQIKERRGPILVGGFMAGLLSIILTATIIGWVFWLPGVYAGTVLWSMHWNQIKASQPG